MQIRREPLVQSGKSLACKRALPFLRERDRPTALRPRLRSHKSEAAEEALRTNEALAPKAKHPQTQAIASAPRRRRASARRGRGEPARPQSRERELPAPRVGVRGSSPPATEPPPPRISRSEVPRVNSPQVRAPIRGRFDPARSPPAPIRARSHCCRLISARRPPPWLTCYCSVIRVLRHRRRI